LAATPESAEATSLFRSVWLAGWKRLSVTAIARSQYVKERVASSPRLHTFIAVHGLAIIHEAKILFGNSF
jgi:hypothetical protein